MWRVVIACLALFGSIQLPAAERVIDLNAPGALETLARKNPEQHRKIVTILDQVQTYRIRDVPLWLQTTFGAQQGVYTLLLRVSNPPKRDLSFVLEGTRYQARVIEPVKAQWLAVQ